MPGWSEVWHNGWIFWWLLGGCCGARWASTVQPIGAVHWKESDQTIAAATPTPKGGHGAAHSLARRATHIGDKGDCNV